ncbi:hypothetical protein Ancab_002843 [Ancistrocladus abbreviatus]
MASSSITKESMIQQQQPPPSHASSSSAVANQAEDESRRKNTDCVYFLASPLTCKKGSECEYRHSEGARLNPRDCWYWMNTVCLNPKCSFRHPPLDGLLGVPAAASSGSSFPPAPVVSSTPYNAPKQGVACIYFQKGYCLKGDRCPFLHGSNPTSNKVPPVPAAAATDPSALGKAFGGLEKCTQQKIIPQVNASKLVESFPEAKATPKAPVALPRDRTPAVKYGLHSTGLIKALPTNNEAAAAPVDNGNSKSKSNNFHPASSLDDPNFKNDRDADELLRESSPGFDVLVDDDLRDADYYHNEDHFVRIRSHDGRNLNELEIGHSEDYNLVAAGEHDVYHDPRGYDLIEHVEERYAWEQQKGLTDRSLREAAHIDRRGSVEDSDLRLRLSKQRRVNGLRSVVNPDYAPKRNSVERGHQNAWRDSYQSPPHEGSLSSRLHGRIKLPRRSPVNGGNMLAERGNDRGRNQGRLSPSRRSLASHQGRLRDRLRGSIHDNLNEGKNTGGPRMKRDMLDGNDTNFAGPKSLAELKVAKQSHGKEQQMKHEQSASVGKHIYSMLEGSQSMEGNILFEGPKPLREILKRKREAEAAASLGTVLSGNNEDDKQTENKELRVSSNSRPAIQEKQIKSEISLSLALESEAKLPDLSNKEENKSITPEGDVVEASDSNKKMKLTEVGPSQANDVNVSENEEGLIAEGVEDNEQELAEEYDQGEGEYEYEHEDGEGYNLEEGENAYPEEDYMDEDDGDDFAKKIGVMFS